MSLSKILKDTISPEFQITVFQPQRLGGIHHTVHLKGGRLRPVQYLEPGDLQFNGAGWKVRVGLSFEPWCHLALHGKDPLISQDVGPFVALFVDLRVKDDLGDSFPVSKVYENQIPQISPAIDPPHQ